VTGGIVAQFVTQFSRAPNTQNAGWFLDLYSSKRLDLNPPYQRRSVWNLGYKRFFIDSVLRNYPTPSIFLDADVSPVGGTNYKVIDGKQRLTSIIEFVEDRFPTPDSLEDLQLAGKYFSDLPDQVRVALFSYVFTVENIHGASPAELNQAFDRLNRNVARLNKQELRHARYGGAFIAKAETIANDPFWTDAGLVTPARIRRMLDVEYVSELYVIAMKGIQDGKDYLDSIYAQNDEEIAGEREADRLFRWTQRYLENINSVWTLRGTRFANVADFYSLWAAVTNIRRSRHEEIPEPAIAAERLDRLEQEIKAQRTQRSRRYLLAARQGSNKRPTREARASIVTEALTE